MEKTLTNRVWLLLGIWLALALSVSLSGIFVGASAPAIGITNWSLVCIVGLLTWRVPSLRSWAQRVSLRPLVLYHIVRFVGIYFLVLYSQGRLPYSFAVPGGWGDIIVAVLAVAVGWVCFPLRSLSRRWALLAWNTVGLVDILLVIAAGMREGLADASRMVELTHFPLSLLPLFIVPLIILTHGIIFVRLRALRA